MRMVFVFLLGALLAVAQDTQIKRVPVTPVRADQGKAMFDNYCAVCHGLDGKGDGPARPALEGHAGGPDAACAKERRKIPGIARSRETARGE